MTESVPEGVKEIDIHDLSAMTADQEAKAREYAKSNPPREGNGWEWIVLHEDGRFSLYPAGLGAPKVSVDEKPIAFAHLPEDWLDSK